MVSDHTDSSDVVVPRRPCGVEAVEAAVALQPAERANWEVILDPEHIYHEFPFRITHKTCGETWRADHGSITHKDAITFTVVDTAVCHSCMRK